MNIFRKSKIQTSIFSAIWLVLSLSYAYGAQCLCCDHSEPKSNCCAKTHVKECCPDSKHPSKDCQCDCISCGNFSRNDLLRPNEYIKTFGNDQLSAFEEIPSTSHFFILEQDIVCFQYNTFPLKYPSLFLINSSFLL